MIYYSSIYAGHQTASIKPGGKNTSEYMTLFANQAKLADHLADTPGTAKRLAFELFARNVVSKAVKDAVANHGPQVAEIDRVQSLITTILSKVDINPKKNYYEFRAAMLGKNVGVDSDAVDEFVPVRGMMILQQ